MANKPTSYKSLQPYSGNLMSFLFLNKCLLYYCHGAHTREEQEHTDEDVNSNNSL